MKYYLIALIVIFSSIVMFAQENVKQQTKPDAVNKKLRVGLYFDGRKPELVNFVKKIGESTGQKFQGKVEVYLFDVSKDEEASKEVEKMLNEIFKGKIPKDINTDVICLFEDGEYIIGSDFIESRFQPIILSKLYPGLVKTIADISKNNTQSDSGLMKSNNYQGSASLGNKPVSNQNVQKSENEIDAENDYLKKYHLLLNILISIISIIFGFFLGFIIFHSSKKHTLHQTDKTE